MAAPTALAVSVDLEEYSRFEADANTITVLVTPTGADVENEVITIELVKARRGRDEVIVTKEVVLTGEDEEVTTTIYLPDVVDSDVIPKVRRGQYFIRATSETDTDITEDSADFRVSVITTELFRERYLHGVDLTAGMALQVKAQPVALALTVIKVSKGHSEGWVPLTYNYSISRSDIVRTLSWCGGPQVPVRTGTTRYLLRKGSSDDYIEVRVPSVSALPTQVTTEELLIEKASLDDHRVQEIVDEAISWLEDSELTVFLEPTRIVTQFDSDELVYPADSDIPVLTASVWDRKVDPVTFFPPTGSNWISFRLPQQPLLKFEDLYGATGQVRMMDINLSWVEIHEKGGWVELVPFSQQGLSSMGTIWLGSLSGHQPIPNFWNFTAIVGFRETPAVLIELISKKAAIDVLTLIGQALKPGVASTSVSRDGVSESVSYLNTQQFGIFTSTITGYTNWINDQMSKLRGAFRGANMAVV